MAYCFSRITVVRALAAAALYLVLASSLWAQIGNDNPTGISGAFNGNVHTAGSYDPYTGNATRSVTDISVAGAVGAYPLAFTRTMNSRYNPGAGSLQFGASGSWRHSYQWNIEPIVYHGTGSNAWSFLPLVYSLNYPDGRRVAFFPSNTDTKYRGGLGISDRFQQLTDVNGGQCFLLLPDGGKVVFEATIDRAEDEQTHIVTSTFTYQFVGIIDPHGQVTTVTYGPDTTTIQEPAGRTLTLYYITTPWNGDTVIDRVVASDGRIVKYNYGGQQPAGNTMYTYLGNVQYQEPNGVSTAQAIYAYQPSNIDPNGRMLLSWAIDPMFAGPMWAISYSYVPVSEGGIYGQLKSENYLDPFTGTPGQAVSSLSINGNSRTETRGDGPSRTFNYLGGKLVNYTDFKGQTSSISHDANGYSSGFTDARGKTTSTLREGLIGAPSVLTHPDTEHSTQEYGYTTANGAPYYSHSRKDERQHETVFTRDPITFLVTRIDYPNGAFEEFQYTDFDQVRTHTKSSGGTTGVATETFTYDARQRLETYIPPATPSDPNPADHPTRYYYYERGRNLDRLLSVVDPRGNGTWYEYNWRGQVTRVTHQDSSFSQMGYNVDGTLAWTADENHPNASTNVNERTRYVYDNYKRVTSVTNPLNEATTFNYALDWVNPYLHTTGSIKFVVSPLNKNVVFDYDENFRKKDQVAALGTPDEAWTLFHYDEVGNLTSVTDPRGNITTYGYDNRNRRKDMTNPAPFNNEVTSWEYDPTNNLTKEIRPDQSFRRTEYDSMNREIDTYGFANEHTHYDRDLAGNVYQMIDAKGAIYGFGYDELNRKTSATYPADASGAIRTEPGIMMPPVIWISTKTPGAPTGTCSTMNATACTSPGGITTPLPRPLLITISPVVSKVS